MAKLCVLIAGDDDDMRQHMVALLSRDYQVIGVVTNGELVQAATRMPPDVIVSEISTPRMDGIAASKKLIVQGKLIPFVFVCSESQEVINVRRDLFLDHHGDADDAVAIFDESFEQRRPEPGLAVSRLWGFFAFVSSKQISMHLVNTVEAVHSLANYDSPVSPNFFDHQPEDQNVVLIEEQTLRKAEQMILSCERCNSRADVLFSEIIDRLTGSDTSVTDYILKKPGTCPGCFGAVTGETLVEPDDRG